MFKNNVIKRIGLFWLSVSIVLSAANYEAFANTISNTIHAATSHDSTKENTTEINANEDDYYIVGTRLMEYKGSDTELVLPEGITAIDRIAFWGSSVAKVVLPNTVTQIDTAAFGECTSLESIFIPPSVKRISKDAFIYSAKLKTIAGVENSYAETFAAENNYTFLPSTLIRASKKDFSTAPYLAILDSILTKDSYSISYKQFNFQNEDNWYLPFINTKKVSAICILASLPVPAWLYESHVETGTCKYNDLFGCYGYDDTTEQFTDLSNGLVAGTTPSPTPTDPPRITTTPISTPSPTPLMTVVPSATPYITLSPTPTPTKSPTTPPTKLPTITPTITPTATPRKSPTASPTKFPTQTPPSIPIVTVEPVITTIPEKTYKIIFVTDEDTSIDTTSITVKNGQTYGELPTPQKKGFTFEGWYTSNNSEEKISKDTIINLASDQSLYPKWTRKKVKILLDGNGGFLNYEENSLEASFGFYLPKLPTPTRESYYFLGWFTAPEGGTQIAGHTTCIFEENQTLYAHWIKEFNSIKNCQDVSFSFTNTSSTFTNTLPYHIPHERYEFLFSKNKIDSLQQQINRDVGGLCYGMVSTSAMLFSNNNSIDVSDFSPNALLAKDLKLTDTSTMYGLSLQELLEVMHISQYSDISAEMRNKHKNKLNDLCNEVLKSQTGTCPPVMITFDYIRDLDKNEYSGHALLAIRLEDNKLYVYDPNIPLSDEPYIQLEENEDGEYVGWSYQHNGLQLGNLSNCDASRNSSIYYLSYDEYVQPWMDRNNKKYNTPATNLVKINSKNVIIRDKNGVELANIKNGIVNSTTTTIYSMIPDVTDENYTYIYLPSDGEYQFCNQSTDLKDFTVTITYKDETATVTTESSTIAFSIDTTAQSCKVSCNSPKGNSFYMKLSSTEESEDTVEVSGTSTKEEIVYISKIYDHILLSNSNFTDVKLNNVSKKCYLLSVNYNSSDGTVLDEMQDRMLNTPHKIIEGTSTSLTIQPQEDFRIKNVLVNQTSIGNVADYHIESMKQNYTINVEFTNIYIENYRFYIQNSVAYTGKVCKPRANLYYYNPKTNQYFLLEEAEDYVITYHNNTNIGTGLITITGLGIYDELHANFEFKITLQKGTAFLYKNAYYKLQANNKLLFVKPVSKAISTFSVPEKIKLGNKNYAITQIADYAFYKCKKLKSINITAKYVTRIGKCAFQNCTNLKNVYLKTPKLSYIGSNTFKGTNRHIVIQIPKKHSANYKKLLIKKGLSKKAQIYIQL